MRALNISETTENLCARVSKTKWWLDVCIWVLSASAKSDRNLINRRLTKRQQMHWSLKGAHYLMQKRVELLDGRLEKCFAKRFPHFRSPEVTQP